MEDLANEFSSYAMIEDIGSSTGAPSGLQSSKNKSSDNLEDHSPNFKKHNFSNYKSKLNYSVNLNVPNAIPVSSQKNAPKTSRHRYSTRSSSILLKSNSLALSDSESTLSDDTKEDGGRFFNNKQRAKKSKRKKPEKEIQHSYPYIPISNSDQFYGKRKRNTTISLSNYSENNSGPQMSNYTINKLKKSEFNGLSAIQNDFTNKTSKLSNYVSNENKMEMDCDEQEDSTSLSEESNLSDSKFEADDNRFADDEQTDYELSSFHKKSNTRRQYGRTNLEKTGSFSIVNSFSMLSPISPSTSSSVLWTKRRRRNLPNNHFN